MKLDHGREEEKVLTGKTLCPGIAVGKVYLLESGVKLSRREISVQHSEREKRRYDRAVRLVSDNIQYHIERMHGHTGIDAEKIMEIHKLMLQDWEFHEEVQRRISTDHTNAEWALIGKAESVTDRLESTRDAYFQARIEDVWDMTYNILSALSLGASRYAEKTRKIEEKRILVSEHLFISEVMQAKRFRAKGFITESKALTSHAAILLKSFNIPSVGALDGVKRNINDGDEIIIDGAEGRIIVKPAEDTRRKYFGLARRLGRTDGDRQYTLTESKTANGIKIALLANVDNPYQIDLVRQNRLEGIGLFRTEFLLFNAETFPDEDLQHETYRGIMEAAGEKPIVIRTFDIGADKRLPYLERCIGQNPALGLRGIRRHIYRRPQELRTQLRAILRAASGFSISILFPMITTLEDVRKAKEHLDRVKQDLRDESRHFCSDIRVGAMIEIPSAAISVESILSEVDFVSVGTNDLIQYLVAADRDNESVQQYVDANNDSVVFILRYIIDKAFETGRLEDVTICGEIASDLLYIPLLLHMGYRSLSISPVMAKDVRGTIEKNVARTFEGE
jgi:phosphotransferase system enzyme I (PtsI)